MSEFMTNLDAVLSVITEFLMTEPIIYFVGLIILAFITRLVMNLTTNK